MDTGELLREQVLLARIGVQQVDDAVSFPERRLHRVCQAGGIGGLVQHQPVHDDLNGMPLLLVQVEGLGQVAYLAVQAHPHEAGLASVLKDLLVFTLLVDHLGGQNHQAPTLGHSLYGIHYLLYRLPLHRTAAFGTVGPARPCEEQAQVVVHLRHGAHGGAWVVGHTLLVYGDGGGQPLYVLHVRLVHTAQELAGVCRQRLDIAALPLGVDGVEGKGGLAGARHAGDDHQLVTGNGDVYVLKVVLSGTLDDYVLQGHAYPAFCICGMWKRVKGHCTSDGKFMGGC